MKTECKPVTGQKPEGGFIAIAVAELYLAWWFYETGRIDLFDLRMWFALHEAKARRCHMQAGRKPRYNTDELMALTGQQRRSSVRSSLRRLEQSGLVTSRRSSIAFASCSETLQLPERAEFARRFCMITNRKRRVPVPRRMIRLIAAKSRRVLIATVLGHLFRLLYLRDGCCRADGNCKASWIAEVLGVDVRSVKRGREQLISSGFLIVQETPQWYRNRYGWRGAVNLKWSGRVNDACNAHPVRQELPPPEASAGKKLPRLSQNQYLSSRVYNHKPASRRSGFLRERNWRLRRICIRDLLDDMQTEKLFERGLAAKLVSISDRLNVFAAAEHAKRVGRENPPGLFVWLLTKRRWDFVTQADEDAARCRLQRMDSRQGLIQAADRSRIQTLAGDLGRGQQTVTGVASAGEVLEQCLAA